MKQISKIARFYLALMLLGGRPAIALEGENRWLMIASMRKAFLASMRLPANELEAWLITKVMVSFDRKQEGCYPKVRFDQDFVFNK